MADHRHLQGTETRRSFLQKTAAAAGAAAVLGSAGRVRARDDRPIPRARRTTRVGAGDPIRIGIIGPGGMGTGHARALMNFAKQERENVEIVALCDVCDVRAAECNKYVRESQGEEVPTYRKHEELLARDDVDGVVVATVEHWHGPICEDAIAAGKDVYCEKPMTLRLDDALRLREVVHANPDVIFQVGTQKMMLPKFTEARRLIEQGAIGKPVFSQTSYCRNSKHGEWLYYAINPEWDPAKNIDWERWCGSTGRAAWDPEVYARWRRYKAYSTGIVGDLLVHEVTPLLYALGIGWPTRVNAIGGNYIDKAMENHDQVNINAQFGDDDHTMIVAGSTCNATGIENMIRGHKANIYLNGRHCVMRPEQIYANDVDPLTVECDDIGNDQDALRLNWLESIRTREPARSNVDLATKVMVLVDLATRSMWDGHTWDFDPEAMRAARA